MTTHLVWFRRDLRLHDNLALAAACRDRTAQVIALYISTPEQWKAHEMAPRQAAFVSAQLNALQTALAEKASRFCLMKLQILRPAWKPSKTSAHSIASADCFITINTK